MSTRQDEIDPEDEDIRATRTTRRTTPQTERLPRTDEYGQPLRQDWRASRTSGRPPRRAQALPTSGQEFALWLQRGGWKILAVASAIVLIAILLLVFNRAKPLPSSAESDSQTNAIIATPGSSFPTVTPPISPTAALAGQSSGAQLRVTGTDTEGLFLRPEHSADGAPVTTLPEGTVVTVIGPDYVGADRVWKNVRSPDGKEGWVASEFVKPVQ